jgi:hypothetical protein
VTVDRRLALLAVLSAAGVSAVVFVLFDRWLRLQVAVFTTASAAVHQYGPEAAAAGLAVSALLTAGRVACWSPRLSRRSKSVVSEGDQL